MNQRALLGLAASLLLTQANPSIAQAADDLASALAGGKAELNGRLFHFNRSFDRPGVSDSQALALGGIAKYETAQLGNWQLGLAYYGSHSLSFLVDREDSRGSSLLKSDGEDIAMLGELYLDYSPAGHQLRIGRQRLATPLMNDHDLRMLPASYQAVVYRHRPGPDSLLELGHVERYSGFASTLGRFDRQTARWGEAGLGYLYGETRLGPAALRGQYIRGLEGSGQIEEYRYLDARLPLPFVPSGSVTAQAGQTRYPNGPSSTMFGLRADTRLDRFDIAVLYNQIRGQSYRTVQSGILYTDLQQGYANYDPSRAWGAQIAYRFNQAASLRLAHVEVASMDIDRYRVDDFKETNLDFNYRIDKNTSIRLRHSRKDQDRRSTREDRDDFRVILYFKL